MDICIVGDAAWDHDGDIPNGKKLMGTSSEMHFVVCYFFVC